MLSDFYRGTRKGWSLTITKENELQDIAGDVVKVSFFDPIGFGAPKLVSLADVTTEPNTAKFNLTSAQTGALVPGTYRYEILWVPNGGDAEMLEAGLIEILEAKSAT
jgi:hypothetical protein